MTALGSCIWYSLAYLWHIFALGSCLEFLALELLLAYLWHIFGICLAYVCNYCLYDYPLGLESLKPNPLACFRIDPTLSV